MKPLWYGKPRMPVATWSPPRTCGLMVKAQLLKRHWYGFAVRTWQVLERVVALPMALTTSPCHHCRLPPPPQQKDIALMGSCHYARLQPLLESFVLDKKLWIMTPLMPMVMRSCALSLSVDLTTSADTATIYAHACCAFRALCSTCCSTTSD